MLSIHKINFSYSENTSLNLYLDAIRACSALVACCMWVIKRKNIVHWHPLNKFNQQSTRENGCFS